MKFIYAEYNIYHNNIDITTCDNAPNLKCHKSKGLYLMDKKNEIDLAGVDISTMLF